MSKEASDLLDSFESSESKKILDDFESSDKGQTLEQKYLYPAAYPILSTIEQVGNFISKPYQAVMAVPGKMAATLARDIQGKPMVDDRMLNAGEFINKYGAPVSAAMREIDTGPTSIPFLQREENKPLADFMQKEFPDAYNRLKNVSEKDILASFLDMQLAGKATENVLPKKTNPTVSPGVAGRYLETIATDKGVLQNLKERGKFGSLKEMVANNPETYLKPFDPESIYNSIEGEVLQQGGRSGGSLDRQLGNVNEIIEKIPRQDYSYDPVEMQKLALSKIPEKALESQRSAAENIIKSEVPVIQPSTEKIAKIETARQGLKDLRLINKRLDEIGPQITAEREGLISKSNMIKNDLIDKINQMPELVQNPEFNGVLDWLANLPIENSKNTIPASPSSVVPSGKVSFNVPGGMSKESNFRINPIHDIIQGQQNIPEMIPNLEKSQALGSAIEEISKINKEIKDIMEMPSGTFNNKKLLSLLDERKKLMDSAEMAHSNYYENFDPTMPYKQRYIDFIREQQLRPASYTSEIRRRGNRLMSAPEPGEVATDLPAKQLAGEAIQSAAKESQDIAMSGMPQGLIDQYNNINTEISNLLNMRELVKKNLSSGNQIGQSGVSNPITTPLNYVARNFNRYVAPSSQYYGGKAKNALMSSIGKDVGYGELMHSFKIPKTSDQVLANKDLVEGKIRISLGDKEANDFAQIQDPDQLRAYMVNLKTLIPQEFEKSKYNSFDGYIDPAFKQQAINDIVKDKGSPSQNAYRMEQLLHEGKIDGIE